MRTALEAEFHVALISDGVLQNLIDPWQARRLQCWIECCTLTSRRADSLRRLALHNAAVMDVLLSGQGAFRHLWAAKDLVSIIEGRDIVDIQLPWNTCNPTLFAFVRQLLVAFKKTEIPFNEDQHKQARQDFVGVDDAVGCDHNSRVLFYRGQGFCGQASQRRDGPNIGGYHRRCSRADREPKARRTFAAALEFVPEFWDRFASAVGLPDTSGFGKHGPGVVADTRGDKYHFKYWPPGLERFWPSCDWAFASLNGWVDAVKADRTPKDADVACKIAFVPKDLKGPRTIAIECAAKMFCQQTLKREFETASVRDVVLAGFITFRDQTPNQELALRGSETGRIATVDLSKASDRISLSLVKAAFGANQPLLERMLASRSGDSKVGDEVVSLKKYASMGNATTFPVQTFIFLGIVLGCCLAKTGLDARKARDRKVLRRSVRVFGDDILVPVEVIPVLLEVLTHYGLRVNTSKSFWTGWFRESCGMDAYRGVDVTPTYVRQLLGSQAPEAILSRIACANLMHARGWWQTARFLTTLVPSDKLAVVGIDSGEFGLHSFVGSSCRHLKKRWSKRFQCQEVKCLVPKDKANTVETNGWARLLRNFNEAGEIRSREFFTDESFLQAYRTSVSLKTLWVHRPK